MVGILRRLAIDVGPLRRSRNFGLLWIGSLVSETGSNIALVALYVQVYRLTGSSLAVGLIGAAQLVPLVALTVLGGPLVDRVDRRPLLVWSQTGEAVACAVLLAGALVGHPPLVVVYVGAAAVGALGGYTLSVRSAITPNLVTPEELPAALALNQVMWNTCLIVGPAVGGVIVARLGLGWAYGIDLASFSAAILASVLLTALPPVRTDPAGTETTGWRSVVAGFTFLRGRHVLQSVFLVDLVAMVFGMPRALFPVLATTEFGGGAEVVGLLFSAASIGAVLGALTSGWVGRIRRQGLAVIVAVAVWGLGIVAFGFSSGVLWFAMAALAVAGAADVVSAVFRGTILQTNVPDDLRGRISAVNILVVTGGPRLGDVEAGAVAALTSPVVSVVAGGVMCIAGVVVLALAVPEFARYRTPAGGGPAFPPDGAAGP